MTGRSLKNIIFRHAIISLVLLLFSIFIIVYNVSITIIYDINNSKYENEVQMTAKYLDMFFDSTAESFLSIVRGNVPLDRKIGEISRNRAVLRSGFLCRVHGDFPVPVRFSPVNPDAFFPSGGFQNSSDPYFFSTSPVRDKYDSSTYEEISIVYPLENNLFIIVFLDRNYINGLLAPLKNAGAVLEKSMIYDSGKNYVTLENHFYNSEYDRAYRYALKNNLYLELHVDFTKIEDDILKLKVSILFVFLIFISWLFIQNIILQKRVFHPINRLKDLVTFISRGRFDIKLHDDSYQEISDLSDKLDMMVEKISELTKESYEKEILTTQADIKTLQEQINPHFLLNTLNSLKLMAINSQNADIIKTIDTLGNLMHYGLYDQDKKVPIKEELECIQNYVAINQIRFKKSIILSIECPEPLLTHQTLKLILQPVVDNCIKFGFRADRALEIKVSVSSTSRVTSFVIADNGNGIEEGRLKYFQGCLEAKGAGSFSHNLGLINVNRRIKLQYGWKYGLSIDSKVGEGTEVTIRIPDELCDY